MCIIKNSLIIFLFVTFIYAKKENDWRKSICKDIKYDGPVVDKPDLLVHQTSVHTNPDLSWSDWRSLCRLSKTSNHSESYNVQTYKNLLSIDYDFNNKTLFATQNTRKSRGTRIIQIKPDGTSRYFVFESESPVLDIALDWVTQNVYLFTQSEVEVVNFAKRHYQVFLFRHEKPVNEGAIVLHPNKGYMFLLYRENRSICRRNLDGSRLLQLRGYNDSVTVHSIVLDYRKNRLYWSLSSDHSSIRSSNIDGSREIQLPIASSHQIAVDRSYVYYSLWSTDRTVIHRANKTSGLVDPSFNVSNPHDQRLQTYVGKLLRLEKRRRLKRNHPCLRNNGGCPDICIAVPSKARAKRLIRICR